MPKYKKTRKTHVKVYCDIRFDKERCFRRACIRFSAPQLKIMIEKLLNAYM